MRPATARAAVMLNPRHPLKIVHYPLPTVAPGCLLVKVTCCTICGSDVHTWLGRRASRLPTILGHEIVGTIAEMGAGVHADAGDKPLSVGDRITWTIMDSCGQCYFCRQKGLPMKCRHLKKYGHAACADPPHFTGGFAEYCYLTPGTGVIKLPDTINDLQAAPANCALATVVAGWEMAALKPFDNVLILGAGALGIYAAALAAFYGCHKIIAIDQRDRRLEFIRSFGATDTLNVHHMDTTNLVREVKKLTHGLGADSALEVAGSADLIPTGLKCLRTGGRLVEIGNSFPDARFSYDACDLVWRRLTLTGLHNYDTKHLQMAVDFLDSAKNRFCFENLVTHRFQLQEVNAALEKAASGAAIRVALLP